jgi:adenylosuccinate synthetase
VVFPTPHISAFSDIMGSEAILVLGSQFGDEGKGKLIDIIAAQRDIWYVEVIPRASLSSFLLVECMSRGFKP